VAGIFSGEVNIPGAGNINPLAGQNLQQGGVTLPRLPQMQAPFGDISNVLKDLGTTTAAVDAGMVDLSVNTKDAAAAMKSVSDRVSEATNALFGGGTREELEVQRKIAEIDRKLLGNPGGRELASSQKDQLMKDRALLESRQSIMEADNKVQRIRVQLADRNLLSEQQQNTMTEILIDRTADLTAGMGFAETALGKFANALGIAASQIAPRAPVFDYSGGYPVERRDLTGARI
jgi:hypothetical protein